MWKTSGFHPRVIRLPILLAWSGKFCMYLAALQWNASMTSRLLAAIFITPWVSFVTQMLQYSFDAVIGKTGTHTLTMLLIENNTGLQLEILLLIKASSSFLSGVRARPRCCSHGEISITLLPSLILHCGFEPFSKINTLSQWIDVENQTDQKSRCQTELQWVLKLYIQHDHSLALLAF